MKRIALLSLSLSLLLGMGALKNSTDAKGTQPALSQVPARKPSASAKSPGASRGLFHTSDMNSSKGSSTEATNAPSLTNTSLKNTPIKDKWALVIGISNFAHPEYNLKYAAKDASDFKDFLIKDCNFAPDHIRFLANERATRGAIMDAFGDSWLPRVVMPGDLVVIFISTHGTPASRDAGGKNYILAHDTDWNRLYSEGVEMNGLSTQIKERVKTDRVLIVMDTCYSGAAADGARGKEAYANFDANDIAQGTGRLVLSSSSPEERSWEGAGYQNGIFTHNLIQALQKNNKKIDVLTAFDDVKKNVQWEAQSNFGAAQTPSLGGKWEGVNLVLSLPPSEPRSVPGGMKDIPSSFDNFDLGTLNPTALSSMGIARMDAGKGAPGLFPTGPEMVLPDGLKRVFLLGGIGTTSELILQLEHPAETFSLTRIGVINGSSMPKWRMDGYDASGQLVATTGEANFSFDNQPRKFTLSGKTQMVQVRLMYDNRMPDGTPWSTYNSLPIVKFEHTH